jgi:hypothetical protein
MGSAQRRKGAEGERELAAILGAEKVSGMFVEGPDLEWRGYYVEVKRRKTNQAWSLPDRLLADGPIVGLRADRGEWLIAMRPETLLDLLDDAKDR